MDKPFWKSNVAMFVILFDFLPAAIMYYFGVISTQDSQAMLSVLGSGTLVFLGRDLGTKGWATWRDKQ